MAVGFFFFLDMLLSLLLLRIYFTTGQFVWVSSFSLFQVGGGLTKELLEVGFLSRLCCCYWLARSWERERWRRLFMVRLREDWEEDNGGCHCVRPKEERSRYGAGLLCQWAVALVEKKMGRLWFGDERPWAGKMKGDGWEREESLCSLDLFFLPKKEGGSWFWFCFLGWGAVSGDFL